MGRIYPGVPRELVSRLKEKFNISHFVETGTHKGNTAFWASHEFKQVVTVEQSDQWHETTKKKYQDVANIEFLHGCSLEILPHVIKSLKSSALFWLDAHWSGRQTAGVDDQCPLLGEINAVNSSELEHFILIDDARLFLSSRTAPRN